MTYDKFMIFGILVEIDFECECVSVLSLIHPSLTCIFNKFGIDVFGSFFFFGIK